MNANGTKLQHSPGILRLRVLGVLVSLPTKKEQASRRKFLGLDHDDAASTSDIQDELGVRSIRTVEITLGRLESDGYAAKVGPARWAATKQGRKYASQICDWLGCC